MHLVTTGRCSIVSSNTLMGQVTGELEVLWEMFQVRKPQSLTLDRINDC